MADPTSAVKTNIVMCVVCTKFKEKLDCEECRQPICFNCRKSYFDRIRWRRYDIICNRCLKAKVVFYYKKHGIL